MKYLLLALALFLPLLASGTGVQVPTKSEHDAAIIEYEMRLDEIAQGLDALERRVTAMESEPVVERVVEPKPEPTPGPIPSKEYATLTECMADTPANTWTTCGSDPIPLKSRDSIPGNLYGYGPNGAVYAWVGAAFDGETMYFQGGGHKSYGGNEIYAFHAPTLSWRIEAEHRGDVVMAPNGGSYPCHVRYDTNGDGKPNDAPSPRHTYDGIVYAEGKIYVSGGIYYCPTGGGHGTKTTYTYDVRTGEYKWPEVMETDGVATKSGYDPVSSCVILTSKRHIACVRDGQTISTGSVGSWGSGLGIGLMVGRDFAMFDPRGLRLIEIKADGTIGVPRENVLRATDLPDGYGRAGHAVVDSKVVLWPGGRKLYVIDSADWSVFELPNLDGPAPSSDNSRGVYSKYAYLPEYNAFIGYNNVKEGVWFYKLAEGGQIPHQPQPELEADLECDDRIFALRCGDLQTMVNVGGEVTPPVGHYEQCAYVNKPIILNANGSSFTGICGGKATFVQQADFTLKNAKCFGAKGDQGNEACIRREKGATHLINVYFHDSYNGILGGTGQPVVIEDSLFERLGGAPIDANSLGRAHGIYVGDGIVEIRNSTFRCGQYEGHLIKSGAASLRVENSLLDETGCNGSRAIDAYNGGILEIVNTEIKGEADDGNRNVIGYDFEARIDHLENRVVIEGGSINCDGGNLIGWRNSLDAVEQTITAGLSGC